MSSAGWENIYRRRGGRLVSVNILPKSDIRPHVSIAQCWCRPTVTEHYGAQLVLHNSGDGREYLEGDMPARPELTQ